MANKKNLVSGDFLLDEMSLGLENFSTENMNSVYFDEQRRKRAEFCQRILLASTVILSITVIILCIFLASHNKIPDALQSSTTCKKCIECPVPPPPTQIPICPTPATPVPTITPSTCEADSWDAQITTNGYKTIAGKWRYRSYHNLGQDNVTPEQLIFARGNFDLKSEPSVKGTNTISGVLQGGDKNSNGFAWTLDVTGFERPNVWLGVTSMEAQLVAKGRPGTMSAGWIYQYTIVLNADWVPLPENNVPNPPYQALDSFVGSVRRVCCHEPHGLVANIGSTRAIEPSIRKNILNMSKNEQKEYIDAILALKQDGLNTPGRDPLLSTYDMFTIQHNEFSDHAHKGPAFLPWHRQFLLTFEEALRRVSGNPLLALPYWDWSDAATRMDIWTQDLMGGNGTETQNSLVTDGPFSKQWKVIENGTLSTTNYLQRAWGTALADMGHSMGPGFQLNPNAPPPSLPELDTLLQAMILDIYDTPPYSDASHEPRSFRNTLEGWEHDNCYLHNAVHLWVGGQMRHVAISPNDPVFWLHHAFVDKIYALWQNNHKMNANFGYVPISGGPQGHNLNDVMIPFTQKPSDVLDINMLNYNYETEKLDIALDAYIKSKKTV